MSYTSNPCWWTIVQVFAPRPDWSRTLGWRTCKQNAAPIRIFWYSYQKLVAREGSRACQQLRHLQLVCFISSHSFHSTFSGTYRPSALGIQGFQAQNPWHLLESFERIVFFLAWNLHTCQVTFVQLKLRMLKKSMVWWYGMQNPRKICMEHLVQGSKTSYIYIYMVFVFLFPIIPTIQIFSAFEKVGQTRHDSRQGCCLWLWRAQVQMFHLHGGTWEAESSPTLLESFGMILVFPAWPKRKM